MAEVALDKSQTTSTRPLTTGQEETNLNALASSPITGIEPKVAQTGRGPATWWVLISLELRQSLTAYLKTAKHGRSIYERASAYHCEMTRLLAALTYPRRIGALVATLLSHDSLS